MAFTRSGVRSPLSPPKIVKLWFCRRHRRPRRFVDGVVPVTGRRNNRHGLANRAQKLPRGPSEILAILNKIQ